ncbi:hypothetical protein LTR36_000426 [Oleoguttula mirabilis]|uniref:Uncharacterized protein n=1 Tax=Oleoguttula mirabilis TaxID=1507867 RepID=A0AAV9JYH8_9PEZI|nr:hypothetical protein LTR36_000426 [Oleoguttula mirabilis]
MEQRVSRSDLRSPDATPAPDSDSADVIARLKQLGDFDFVQHDGNGTSTTLNAVEQAGDDHIEFQLFATNKPATEPANRIRIRSPTPATGDPGFVNPTRDSGYYFAPALSAVDKEKFIFSALSGEDVRSRCDLPWLGATYPWKTRHLPSSCLSRSARVQSVAFVSTSIGDEVQKKRTRPGKKARIKVRIKLAASRTAAETKEAAEKEKRVRRNREKKVKKKMREKAKKAAGGGGLDEAVGIASGEGSDSE